MYIFYTRGGGEGFTNPFLGKNLPPPFAKKNNGGGGVILENIQPVAFIN